MHSAAKAAENCSGAGPICLFPWLGLAFQCPSLGTRFSELFKGSTLETTLMACSMSFCGCSPHSAKQEEKQMFRSEACKTTCKGDFGYTDFVMSNMKGKEIVLTQFSSVCVHRVTERVRSKYK